MNERMRLLRNELAMTMEAFGQRIGIGKASISRIEAGSVSLTDRNVATICKEFHVNEQWLREGKGEMFVQLSRDEQIAEFIGSVQFEAEDSFKKRLISVLSSLDADEWEVLEKMALKLVENNKGKASPSQENE